MSIYLFGLFPFLPRITITNQKSELIPRPPAACCREFQSWKIDLGNDILRIEYGRHADLGYIR
jgi:hypothetical protein